MAKKTPIEKLDTEIKKILDEYDADVTESVRAATKAVCKAGAAAIRAKARDYGWKDYAAGWTSEVEQKRWTSSGVIFNSKKPGLAHLLEKGHAMVNGGHSKAYPHIKPVEEKIDKEYEVMVINAITGY